jgi:H+/gluconate symporter-like permease
MSPIERVKTWAKEIVDLAIVLIAFGVVVSIIFGSENGWYFGQITENLVAFINDLGNNSLAGIIALFVIIYAFSRRTGTA